MDRHHPPLQDEAGKIGVFGQITDMPFDIFGIDGDFLARAVGCRKADFIKHLLQHGHQPAGPDILDIGIDLDRHIGNGGNGIIGKFQLDLLGCHQGYILLDQRGPRVGQYALETSRVRALSSTLIGKRPCSSGRRSEGLET